MRGRTHIVCMKWLQRCLPNLHITRQTPKELSRISPKYEGDRWGVMRCCTVDRRCRGCSGKNARGELISERWIGLDCIGIVPWLVLLFREVEEGRLVSQRGSFCWDAILALEVSWKLCRCSCGGVFPKTVLLKSMFMSGYAVQGLSFKVSCMFLYFFSFWKCSSFWNFLLLLFLVCAGACWVWRWCWSYAS